MPGDDMITIWIHERNNLQRQLRTCQEPSIRSSLETKLERANQRIDELISAEEELRNRFG